MLLSMFMGLVLYSYIQALMAVTLTNIDAPRVEFQSRLFAANQFMLERKLGKQLQVSVMVAVQSIIEKTWGRTRSEQNIDA